MAISRTTDWCTTTPLELDLYTVHHLVNRGCYPPDSRCLGHTMTSAEIDRELESDSTNLTMKESDLLKFLQF